MRQLPYLIVGQGIAGTLVAWFLKKAGHPFLVVDNNHQTAASKVAAGIINPITGRRFVKSWNIEAFLPFAKSTYLEIQKELGIDIWRELDIIRYFSSHAEGNNWLSKTTWPGYDKFLLKNKRVNELDAVIANNAGYGLVKGAKVDINLLTKVFKIWLQEENLILNESFHYQQLLIKKDSLTYKELEFKGIIFCEGYQSYNNPWFSHLPYESAKGEVLIVRIPNLKVDYIIKKHFFLVPLEKDLYWFGSNYEWEDLTMQPTKKGKEYLIKQLKQLLKVEFEIAEHFAAVRPVLKDRRPAIGRHPDKDQLIILNGLGTKGASIAPKMASILVQFLLTSVPLDSAIDVSRFSLVET